MPVDAALATQAGVQVLQHVALVRFQPRLGADPADALNTVPQGRGNLDNFAGDVNLQHSGIGGVGLSMGAEAGHGPDGVSHAVGGQLGPPLTR